MANPRGIPDGVRVLCLAPVHEACSGGGCADCDGGRVVEREWYEGDAIAEGDVSPEAWTAFRERGFIVEAPGG